jgi:hypothetical protein
MRPPTMLIVAMRTVGVWCGGLAVPAVAGDPPEAAAPHGPARGSRVIWHPLWDSWRQ